MTLSNIAEEASTKDDDCVQSVNIDSPAPQIQPCKRTFGSPAVRLPCFTHGLSTSLMRHPGNSGPDVLGVDPSDLAVVTITFYGGISQIIVGVWEISLMNTFSATVFAAYGGFEFVFSVIFFYLESLSWLHTLLTGSSNSHFTVPSESTSLSGARFHSFFSLVHFKSLYPTLQHTHLPFVVCALTCLSLNALTASPHLAIVGGTLGIIASFSAYYSAISLFWAQHTSFSYIPFPLMMAPFNV
ncbi:GPR1/FUN34/yaaH family-domain-containing protein [Suillus cothurnatus]|nr:GPR1/FUN34/yaaH family-domain-containing protein [Suillus cothurnatus]